MNSIRMILAALDSDLLVAEQGEAALEALRAMTPESEASALAQASVLAEPLPVVRGAVGVVKVQGLLLPRVGPFGRLLGLSSTEQIADEIRAHDADPRVQQILLDVDSPGGSVNGIAEAAAAVADASTRVVCHVSGVNASAAYWLTSAADDIVVSPTAVLGSIGVIGYHRARDPSAVVSKGAPRKIASASDVQEMVDEIERVFHAAVAEGRGVSVNIVRSRFGAGGVFIGEQAVRAGLADRVGTVGAAMMLPGATARLDRDDPGAVWAELRAQHPDPEPEAPQSTDDRLRALEAAGLIPKGTAPAVQDEASLADPEQDEVAALWATVRGEVA